MSALTPDRAAIAFCGRHPVRAHLRPKGGWRLATEADVKPEILRAYPRVIEELNCCQMHLFEGPGRPGPGWEGWRPDLIPLDEALAMPVGGEA